MKKSSLLLLISLSLSFVSCQKQQTDEERRAEVERQVQDRLAAEHQAATQQQLDQRESDLNARESDLAARENAPTPTPAMRATAVEQRASVPTADADEDYGAFYTRLDPYGSWLETANYGYVWQPQTAERSNSWRPYTNGRWVYTDAGWTWYSEEPFGWATYHYGRWTRLRSIGWVWVPGDEWAPAWVSWREGNDYVGWAPLPPEARFERGTGIHHWADNYYDIGPEQYTFVPTRGLGDRQIDRAILPSDRNVTIINQTTNITNITYNNTTIVNRGPDYDALHGRTAQPIERLRLERRTSFDRNNPRTVVRGEALQMPAPVIGRSRGGQRPQNIRRNVGNATVERGWQRVGAAAQQIRNKMKAEATPPPDAPARRFVRPNEAAAPSAPAASSTPVRTFPQRGKMTPRPTAVPATPAPADSATPIRNFPQRGKMTPRPSGTPIPVATPPRRTPIPATPSATPATPEPTATPTSSPVESALEAHRNAQRQRAGKKANRPGQETASPTVTPASPTPAATETATPAENAGRRDMRAEKREAKQRKKERRGGNVRETPTPTP